MITDLQLYLAAALLRRARRRLEDTDAGDQVAWPHVRRAQAEVDRARAAWWRSPARPDLPAVLGRRNR